MNWHINLYDTSISPSPEMREAMQYCEVGDDGCGEDPSVNQLEKEAAKLVGKESALFVASGTMGNLVGLMAQSDHGDGIILEAESHIYHNESIGLCAVAGLVPRLIIGERGVLSPESVEKGFLNLNPDYHNTKLLSIENTHNRAGGTITSPEIMQELRSLCRKNNIKIHLDGARIFNAAIALNVPVTDFTNEVDTVMFCLSKGLGAPVGSILSGDHKTIKEARRIRKILGGGMRRVGFMASAGLIALRTGISRLEEDHRLTKVLAKALMQIEGIRIDFDRVQTNIVLIDSSPTKITAIDLKNELQKQGIRVLAMPPYLIRMVIHKDIQESQIPMIVDAVNAVIQRKKRSL